ncbi:hypothetical protein [Halomonas borealis]|uniref:hypothetical protein n=1 Tax=Halomonas borealis TaxID=2508710 RepID=UPI00109F17D1|nr:hypothetical protein [Halomonas borealis]
MWRSWGIILLVGLAGCQALPSRLPVAEPPPAEACRWAHDDAASPANLGGVVAVLESEGFAIRHTEVALGLVSAERSRRTVLHGLPEPDRFGLGAIRGRGGGFGMFDDEATEVERVSVAVGERTVRVTRDLRLFDWRGEPRRSRTASDAAFCRALREAMRRQAEEGA